MAAVAHSTLLALVAAVQAECVNGTLLQLLVAPTSLSQLEMAAQAVSAQQMHMDTSEQMVQVPASTQSAFQAVVAVAVEALLVQLAHRAVAPVGAPSLSAEELQLQMKAAQEDVARLISPVVLAVAVRAPQVRMQAQTLVLQVEPACKAASTQLPPCTPMAAQAVIATQQASTGLQVHPPLETVALVPAALVAVGVLAAKAAPASLSFATPRAPSRRRLQQPQQQVPQRLQQPPRRLHRQVLLHHLQPLHLHPVLRLSLIHI